jgi:ABC-type transport system involved in multi-copper enzyme maturation permease subunit
VAETETPGFLKRLFLNPLALRELRVACRSWKLVIILTAYLLVQGAIFAIWVYVRTDRYGLYEDPTAIGSGLFVTLAVVLVIVVMLVFPAFSSTAIASEHERKSFDLLLLTPLSPWEIATGKFFAAGIQASIFLVATVPLFAIANLFGGIEPAVFLVILWLLVLLSVFISFLGVYASSLVTKSIPAVLVTYMFALFFGLLLLTGFLTLLYAASVPGVAMAFPLVAFLIDPTLEEGILYVGTLTVFCATYCTFLFLSTTNRLKPTSHNKSTGLRLFWTVVALILPAQLAAYFLLARLPKYGMAFTTLIIGTIYVFVMLLIPALTAPAEAPLPSRRVRREMEKLPKSLINGGGRMFFPGSARGAAHAAVLVVVGVALMAVVGWFAIYQLQGGLDDIAQASAYHQEITRGVSGAPRSSPGSLKVSSGSNPTAIVDEVKSVLKAEYRGYLYLLAALGVTVLVIGQVTWRMSLSGLSKALSGVLAGLILALWIVVPFIGQLAGGGDELQDHMIGQMSPVHAIMSSNSIGTYRGLAGITDGGSAEALNETADAFQKRWWTFMGVSVFIGAGLLILNITGHRRVMKLVSQASQAAHNRHEAPPPQTSPEALEHALQAVTTDAQQPPAPPQAPPPS